MSELTIESLILLAHLRGLHIDRAEAERLLPPTSSHLARLAALAAALPPRTAPLPAALPDRSDEDDA
jgi:hypothetical protein